MSLPNEVISGLLASSAKDEDTYQVSRSLRFNSADSAYLNRTFASAGNRQKFTFSCWIKRSKLTVTPVPIIFSGGGAGGTDCEFGFLANDTMYVYDIGAVGGGIYILITSAVYRDTSAWYHIVMAVDSTSATANNRVRLYVNGTEVTSFSTRNNPAQNANFTFNTATGHTIGKWAYQNSNYLDAYLSNIHFIDGQALTPSSFGQSDANGRWVPKAYTGTYGTNGFYLNFSDNSGTTATTLGKDSSPNGNNWTPNNFSVTAGVGNDSLVDSPTNYGTDTGVGGEVRGNYATWNPIDSMGSVTVTEGALKAAGASASAQNIFSGPIDIDKIYFEIIPTKFNINYPFVGICDGANQRFNSTMLTQSTTKSIGIFPTTNNLVRNNNFGSYTDITSGITGFITNDVIMIAYDRKTGKFWYGLNGTWQNSGNPAAGTGEICIQQFSGPIVIFATLYSSSNVTLNSGQRPFAYTAPTGFKSLNTQNLPTPAIKNPSKYMNIATYTGTGATRSITGVGFQPDLVWTKSRSNAETHKLVDSVRGATKALSSETTGDEVTESGLTSFDSDGFTIDGTTDTGYNTNTYTYVGWAWKKGVTPGFDIVNYTGTGVARTISHSLGAVPHFMIVKARTTASTDQGWPVYHRNLTSASYYILLNSNLAEVLASTAWNGTTPSSSVFSVGTSNLTNTNNDTYVAYLWTEIDGFSRFGTYTGNGAADGPFTYTGFKPAYLMTFRVDGTSWAGVTDKSRSPYNQAANTLSLTHNYDEATLTSDLKVDLLANGFKVRDTDAYYNGSGGKYIYAAFAELPFKYSRGR